MSSFIAATKGLNDCTHQNSPSWYFPLFYEDYCRWWRRGGRSSHLLAALSLVKWVPPPNSFYPSLLSLSLFLSLSSPSLHRSRWRCLPSEASRRCRYHSSPDRRAELEVIGGVDVEISDARPSSIQPVERSGCPCRRRPRPNRRFVWPSRLYRWVY